MNKKPELLAPAGTMESVIAAINGGADAVYFGGKTFNARRNAENMTDEEIKTAVTLCHQHGVKVYITLNILIKNNEISEIIEVLNFFKTLNLDGLIVQDIGLIYLIRHYFPEFKLQTSTQASVYGLEGVLFFQKLGFARVVLPREMPLEQVAEIKKKTTVELKIFVHGALCYAYSGQCLMSSMIGGRSGNRGLCAQPCRKNYRLFDEHNRLIQEGYLLSPKDLNTLADLETIMASGVDALKIEGRMKTPEYVYGITRAYREGLDTAAGEKITKSIDDQAVMQVFNRDFTRGHLFNEADLLNAQVGKNRGILIGQVVSNAKNPKNTNKKSAYQPLAIRLNKNVELNVGDGLSFGEDGKTGTKVDAIFTLEGRRLEKGLGGETVTIPCRYNVLAGTALYKNFDKNLMDSLKQRGSQSLDQPGTVVNFKLNLKLGQPAEIQVETQGQKACYQAGFSPETPLKNPIDATMVREQIARIGGTGYELGDIDIDMDEQIFLARSQLNTLRKEVLIKLANTLTETAKMTGNRLSSEQLITVVPLEKELHRKPERSEKSQGAAGRKKVSVAFANMPDSQFLKLLANQSLDQVVLPLLGAGVAEKTALLKDQGIAVLLKTPKIMDDELTKTVRQLLNKELNHNGYLIGNYEALQLLNKTTYYVEADQSFNLFNTLATRALKEWGVSGGVLSPELSETELQEITEHSEIAMVLPVYGAQELMVSKKCLFGCQNCLEKKKGVSGSCRQVMSGKLVDERGFEFPVERDAQGLNHIYNGDTLFLREEILELEAVDTWRIMHRNESLETLKIIIDYYHQQIYDKHWGLPEGLDTAGSTRGSFKRGVK
ncbi:U32 family peptidase [Acetobacterium woodii]|uniref:Putative peptidase n=1 Tax=Acetobacterium woodii (strain ATCC 29683 / DSM 1030 / JCM 2381 / KCTC 1655 / WB1) TaxID=931626 RepID=H6LEH2_ACEWD|nr:U32 family peptidase [Acetobacterium woodii]AFA48075.1 putative peptidase [Acetobacterium woodii DSM 1030]